MAISWKSWDPEVLAAARAEGRFVLLLLTASWSRFGAQLESTTFLDPRVEDAMGSRIVPVRVDVDEFPDVADAFGQGGWPSVVLVDPRHVEDGVALEGSLVVGTTYVEASSLCALVDHATRGDVIDVEALADALGSARHAEHSSLDDSILPRIDRALLASFDERHGGFGEGPKFPHPEALDYAILRVSDNESNPLRAVVDKTLTHMADGELLDRVDGGFFRFAERRDWTRVDTEKLLVTNADLARNYLEAGQLLGRADFLDVGENVVDVLLRDFRVADVGLFRVGFAPDDDYYGSTDSRRRVRSRPRADERLLTAPNARAISALLKAGAVLRRPDVTGAALAASRQLIARTWRPGHGVAHDARHSGQGQLRDHTEAARALLHVLQYTDDRRFVVPLVDILECIARDHVMVSGEFANRDRVISGRATTRRQAALLESAAAAEVLIRGSIWTGRNDLHDVARTALEVAVDDSPRYGYAMAGYGRSVELLLHPPLHIVVVGSSESAATSELYEAASQTYLPSRVVQHLDGATDGEDLARLGLPADKPPTAYVFLHREGVAAHRDPRTLADVLRAANARRLER